MQAGVGVRVMEGSERPLRLHRGRERPLVRSRTSTHSCLVPCRQSSRTCVPFQERSASSRLRGRIDVIAPCRFAEEVPRARAGSGNRDACLAEPASHPAARRRSNRHPCDRSGCGGAGWVVRGPRRRISPEDPAAPQPLPHRQPVRKPVRSRPAYASDHDARDLHQARANSMPDPSQIRVLAPFTRAGGGGGRGGR